MVSGFTSLMFVGLLPITTIYDKVSQLLMTGLFDFYPLLSTTKCHIVCPS